MKPAALFILVSAILLYMALKLKNPVSSLSSLIAEFEGYKDTVYYDKNDGWTIGFGHLIKPGEKFYPYGSVRTITRPEADALLISDTRSATDCVNAKVKVSLNKNQRSALISLVYNIGCDQFKSSTLLAKLNAGDYSAAAKQFGVWVYDDGVKVNGLISRRAKETELFLA